MNFFGHAWLAARVRAEPAFVLGAMLPDLAAMLGLRVERVWNAPAESGRRFHLATDAAFHGAEGFERLVRESARTLREAGLRFGAARAVSHVGVELLLDGWIAERHGVPAAYRPALGLAPTLLPSVSLRGQRDPAPLAALCQRLRAATFSPDAAYAPARLTARLVRILARRPRLALLASELPAVRAWAAGARGAVAHEAAPLLDALETRLAVTVDVVRAPQSR